MLRKIASLIREVQESNDYAMGYRPMTRIISEEMGRTISRNRIKRIMKDEGFRGKPGERKALPSSTSPMLVLR